MDEQFIKTLVENLMEQDPDLTAGDARYAVNAILRAKEETTNLSCLSGSSDDTSLWCDQLKSSRRREGSNFWLKLLQSLNRADQLALFYELMDGQPYGHAN